MTRHRAWALGVVVLLVVAGVGVRRFVVTGSPPPLPAPSLGDAEPRVREKILSALDDVEQAPRSARAWGRLAMILDVHDLKRDVLTCYERATELDPDDFRWPYFAAILAHRARSDDVVYWLERSRSGSEASPAV